MNTAPKWTGAGYPTPQTWLLKKTMPDHLKHEATRVDFGLFGLAYIATDHNNAALMKDGQRMPLTEFYLKTPGHVIGPRDNQSAANKSWAFEWQTASSERMIEQATLHAAVNGRH